MATAALMDVNFDSLVGPTHHFGGMGVGNLASMQHRGQVANPRAAALQGLQKMRLVSQLGGLQAVVPPPPRPRLRFLRRLGFAGSIQQILRQAREESPELLSASWSASAMWAANAATVSAAPDCADGRTHLTVANLNSSMHRSLEPAWTFRWLRRVLVDSGFVVHRPLPGAFGFRDEGAANHMRLASHQGQRGVELFVYGASSEPTDGQAAGTFLPRQSLFASQAIARRHRSRQPLFLRQASQAIDAGAFHNDVVAASSRDLLLVHQYAFADTANLDRVREHYFETTGHSLTVVTVTDQQLSLPATVATYLFNSQLIADHREPDADFTLVCPRQVAESEAAKRLVDSWIASDLPIQAVSYVDLRQSMFNGGGPACLRLRVPMTKRQWESLPETVRLDDRLLDRLAKSISMHYPTEITPADLGRRQLLRTVQQAYRSLMEILL